MKNMFESSAPKVTFGGAAAYGADKAAPKPQPQKAAAASDNSERGWMFDVINKYFDVIVEDEEESGDEAEELEDDDDGIEEHEPVFATQLVAPNQRIPISQVEEEEEDESDYESANDDDSPIFASHVTTMTKQFYSDNEVMEQEDVEEDAEESDVEDIESDEDGDPPHGYGIARSASSSKMRSLFRYWLT
jgi:hypothetical protein